jgi:YidC/Oxa1 family membrane protein insertase
VTLLNPLYELITKILTFIHAGLSPVFGSSSGWAWGLSIVFLTILMRLALIPLFVKQIRTQRAMQVLQPKMKELQAKYKGDRETLNAEMMKLYKEQGANPLAGCLPLLLQMPVFFALFHVLSHIRPDGTPIAGMTNAQVESMAHAKILGAPIAASFKSSFQSGEVLLHSLSASPGTVRVVAAVMVVLMGASTFWTQKQLMTRTAASGDTSITSQQKILLYVLPFSFLFAGFNFPIGVLVYWLTTNLWSMGQQHFVIAKMSGSGPSGGRPAVPAVVPRRRRRWRLPRWSLPRFGGTQAAPSNPPGTPPATPTAANDAPAATDSAAGTAADSAVGSPRIPKSSPPRRVARRPPNSSNRRKGSRRGGRH